MKISVIIPAYDEEKFIAGTVDAVFNRATGFVKEVIVVDGGSRDQTVKRVIETPANVISSPMRGRAAQMNVGASKAKGEILYFLHADSIPPKDFDRQILDQVYLGNQAGCFRLAFDHDHFLLNFYAWCTRFDIDAFRFGDQSLFIKGSLFRKIGGFKEKLVVMEDSEIVKRIKQEESFCILPDKVITSSRRYIKNGIVRLQLIFTLIVALYNLGVSQQILVSIYKKLVH